MKQHPYRDRYLEAVEKNIQSAYKAISGIVPSSVIFTSDPQQKKKATIYLSPPKSRSAKDIRIARGKADLLALKNRFHQKNIHQEFTPKDHRYSQIFDALEEARIETVGSIRYKGASHNMDAAIEMVCQEMPLPQNGDVLDDGQYAQAVRLFARKIFGDKPPPKTSEMLVDSLKKHKEYASIITALKNLKKFLYDQKKFAENCDEFLFFLQQLHKKYQKETRKSLQKIQQKHSVFQRQKCREREVRSQTNLHRNKGTKDKTIQTKNTLSPISGERRRPSQQEYLYKIYTKNFDRVESAQDITTESDLQKLRCKLDALSQPYVKSIARIANKMQRILQTKQLRAWKNNLYEGILDSARLPRIIINPLQPLSFKKEQFTSFKDTVVTLLIDNSGSMRGRPISIAAITCDILSQTLERCGVNVEVLGFTTMHWQGGQSAKMWKKANRPANPGRLNDLRHIIYKSASQAYRHARRNFGLMLQEGLLKENIDGEALLWAFRRLMGRRENRRILIIISDGAPIDDATISNNNTLYLETHLRQTIKYIQSKSRVELLAIGIDHNVNLYYDKSITIASADQLANVMAEELINLLDQKENRRPILS